MAMSAVVADGSPSQQKADVRNNYVHLDRLGASIYVQGFRLYRRETFSCLIADRSRTRFRPWLQRDAGIDHLLVQLDKAGENTLRNLVGPFSIVWWRHGGNELLAARDPLGLLPLYYSAANGKILVSSTLDAFSDHNFNRSFFSKFVIERGNPNTLGTVRERVDAVEPGTIVRWADSRTSVQRFWYPPRTSFAGSFSDAADEFYRLCKCAVTSALDDGGTTWAHLSGGLDSSSVVSMAGHVAETVPTAVLGGTLTLIDTLGNSDESEFADAVTARYGIANVKLADFWPWQSDGVAPPTTERPSRDYPYYARDRAVNAVISKHHATSVLSGIGPDLYLPHTTAHCPDLIWRGKLIQALKELHHAAIDRRATLWKIAFTDGILPLVSRTRVRDVRRPWSIKRWFTDRFWSDSSADEQIRHIGAYRADRGDYYDSQVRRSLGALAERLSQWHYAPDYEIRHPLLDLPLVEHCLQLPFDFRTDVYWSKPVLRTAMKNVLPDKVRMRGSSGIIAPRVFWALRQERGLLNTILREPILADLGCIEPREIVKSLESFDVFKNGEATFLYALLSLETWLSIKSGRRIVGLTAR
jgi:asparagine synthase (glutamine-hydrolysing)